MKPYASRHEAGRKLGRFLADRRTPADLILGLPRGGVIVAAEVARILGRPVDALIVRKIGHPAHREFAVGALAEDGTLWLDEQSLIRTNLTRADLEPVIVEERSELARYRMLFRRDSPPDLKGRYVLIVDDGLATGATAEAAVLMARYQGAQTVRLAAPIASDSAVQRMGKVCDDVLVPLVDPDFAAVGDYYDDFPQAADAEVAAILHGG